MPPPKRFRGCCPRGKTRTKSSDIQDRTGPRIHCPCNPFLTRKLPEVSIRPPMSGGGKTLGEDRDGTGSSIYGRQNTLSIWKSKVAVRACQALLSKPPESVGVPCRWAIPDFAVFREAFRLY